MTPVGVAPQPETNLGCSVASRLGSVPITAEGVIGSFLPRGVLYVTGSCSWRLGTYEPGHAQSNSRRAPGLAQRAVRRQLHQQLPALLWQGEVEATLAALCALRPVAPAEPVPLLEETIHYLEGQRV
jgi:hypothetical protein